MNLKDLDLEIMYESENRELINKFFNESLSVAKRYDRSIGFFSSNVFRTYIRGLKQLVINGGKVRMITSPKLSDSDINALKAGELNEADVINQTFLDYINSITEENLHECELLVHLLRNNILELKIAVVSDSYGMFHEKLGIIDDGEEYISFCGSSNESECAMENNYESFNVFNSWIPGVDKYAKKHRDVFDRHWDGKTNNIKIFNLTDAVKNDLFEKHNNDLSLKELVDQLGSDNDDVQSEIDDSLYQDQETYKLPEWFKVRPYQQEAVQSWVDNDFKGVFEMATGSGKTLTALYAITRLWRLQEEIEKLTVIVVPLRILVNQWDEDVSNFSDQTIKVSSDYADIWPEAMSRKIQQLNRKMIRSLTIITTVSSYKTEKFQRILNKSKKEKIIIFDECHNAGAPSTIQYLDTSFKYRIGLSATPERFEDEEGSEAIYDYFGKTIYKFTLEDAIEQNFLVPYNYYPVLVYLDNAELISYNEITKKIIEALGTDDEDMITKLRVPASSRKDLKERAQIIYGARDKLRGLREVIESQKVLKRTLVYCGTTYATDPDADDNYDEDTQEIQIKQIDAVCKLIGNEFGGGVVKYTSKEKLDVKEFALRQFRSSDSKYLVAIKCLDEGFNIPEVENAIIMSSTRNPKEFIQRRGRVLRKCDETGKTEANIYDMIVLPSPEDTNETNKRIITNELKRLKEFKSICKNNEYSKIILSDLMEKYNLIEEDLIDVR